MMRHAVVFGLACLAACTARSSAPVPLPYADADALLARVRADEDRIRSLRARFHSRSLHRGQTRAADGVLLVRKPDRFRLRLMLPFGLTVFDYVGREDGAWISLPLHGDRGALPADLGFFSRENLGAAFLRGAYAFPGTCRAASAAQQEVEVTCRDGRDAQLTRTLRLDARSATIREESSRMNGAPHMIIRYHDYRRVGDLLLPFRIELNDPAREMSVEISIDHYEVNPTLADELFAVPAGARKV